MIDSEEAIVPMEWLSEIDYVMSAYVLQDHLASHHRTVTYYKNGKSLV